MKPKCDCTKNLERRNCYQQFKTGDGVQKFHCKETKERPPKEPSHGCLFRRPPNWRRFSWAFVLVFLLAPFARAGFSVWFLFWFGTLLTWKLTDWWAVVPSHPPKKGKKKGQPQPVAKRPEFATRSLEGRKFSLAQPSMSTSWPVNHSSRIHPAAMSP